MGSGYQADGWKTHLQAVRVDQAIGLDVCMKAKVDGGPSISIL